MKMRDLYRKQNVIISQMGEESRKVRTLYIGGDSLATKIYCGCQGITSSAVCFLLVRLPTE
jgi:hypothetical protein